jgi:hypothetical protein
MRARMGVAVAAGLVGLAIPAPASGAMTIGETFAPESGATCVNDFTRLQSTSPGGLYAAPAGGVITSWSTQAGSSPASLKLKVGRSTGGDTFTIVGDSEVQTPTPNTLNSYPVRIAVRSGDVIGLYTPTNGQCLRTAQAGYGFHFVNADPPPGDNRPYMPASVGGDLQFDISARLEPDCDSDGFGDETQDPEIPLSETCGKGNRTLTFAANKNKVKKGRRVTLSGQLNEVVRQGPCESGQPVELQRKKPSKTTFTTIEQLQTDAAGAFSAKEKVKKTFEYRAQVAETATCASQTSNPEKVKVRKRKK